MSDRVIVTEEGICLYGGVKVSKETQRLFAEASKKGVPFPGCLTIELPVGYSSAPTGNGNVYETKELEREFADKKQAMLEGRISGTHGAHPADRAELRPDEISHLIIDAWVDKDKKVNVEGKEVPVIMNKWLIIPTDKGGGKDLAALFLAGASVGTSIRGTAVREDKKYMRQYSYYGTDTVGVPSTGIYPGVNNEIFKAIVAAESLENLELGIKERVMEMAGEKVRKSLVTEVQGIAENLKLIGEGKTTNLLDLGARLGRVEAELSTLEGQRDGLLQKVEDLKKIQESLSSEKDEAIKSSNSYEKASKDLGKQIEDLEFELRNKNAQTEVSIKVIEGLRDRFNLADKDAKSFDVAVATVEDLRDYALKAESVIGDSRDYILFLEEAVNDLRDYALRAESATESLRNYALDIETVCVELASRYKGKDVQAEAAIQIVENLRDRIKGLGLPKKQVSMSSYKEHLSKKYPQLAHFKEELDQCITVEQLHQRVAKYLDLTDKAGLEKFIAGESMGDGKVVRRGVERWMGKLV